MNTKIVFVLKASLVLLLLGACSAINPTPAQPVSTPTIVVTPATGVQYQYVTNTLLLPSTRDLAAEYALNIDGDPKKSTENKFGELLSLLVSAAPGLELQTTLDEAINTGQLVTLHMVKADSFLSDPSVSWFVYLGQPAASPSFDSSDKFTLDSKTPLNSPVIGSITNGRFSGGPGSVRVRMFLLGQQVELDLIGVRLESDVNQNGCVNGKIGGGITVEDFRSKLLPAIAAGLYQIIEENNDTTSPLLQTFDSDKDKTITAQELENNPMLMIAISPDLDLLDSSGEFNPGQDGEKDSYSIGLGFTCVPAGFILAGE